MRPPPLIYMVNGRAKGSAQINKIEKRRRNHSRRETISRPFTPIAQFSIRLNISTNKRKNRKPKQEATMRSANRPWGYCVRIYLFQLIWFKVRFAKNWAKHKLKLDIDCSSNSDIGHSAYRETRIGISVCIIFCNDFVWIGCYWCRRRRSERKTCSLSLVPCTLYIYCLRSTILHTKPGILWFVIIYENKKRT